MLKFFAEKTMSYLTTEGVEMIIVFILGKATTIITDSTERAVTPEDNVNEMIAKGAIPWFRTA